MSAPRYTIVGSPMFGRLKKKKIKKQQYEQTYGKNHLSLQISSNFSELAILAEVTGSLTVLVLDEELCSMFDENLDTSQVSVSCSIMQRRILVLRSNNMILIITLIN
jgi:hypothetical protein